MAERSESGKKSAKKMSFEESLGRLEQIVREMEAGSLSLEDMIARFEEGQKLLKFCMGKLDEVERKIEVLVKKGDKMAPEEMKEGAVDREEAVAGSSGDAQEGEELF